MTLEKAQETNGKAGRVAWEATRDWVKDQSPGTIAALVLVPAAVVTVTLIASRRARTGAKKAVRRIAKAAMATQAGRARASPNGRSKRASPRGAKAATATP